MANAYDVANFFIDVICSNEDDHITNLKLNKLMYFAQGSYLARTKELLFDSKIEAWSFGPVVSCIYHKYKVCGKAPIETIDDDYDFESFSQPEKTVLLDVMREYGRYTGSALVNMTHAPDTPWSKAMARGDNEISVVDIQSFFTENPTPEFSIKDIPVVKQLPTDWHDVDEDSEWEDYLIAE